MESLGKTSLPMKHCASLPDLIGRRLLVEYCDRQDLAHAPLQIEKGETDRSYWIRVCAKMFHVSQE